MSNDPDPAPAAASSAAGGLSKTLWVGVGGLGVLIAVVVGVFLLRNPQPSADVAKLEQLVAIASTACVSNTDSESGAKLSASLSLLIENVKGDGGITEYRHKHVGADKALPPELQLPENASIRQCMCQHMPALYKVIGIEMAPPDCSGTAGLPDPLQLRFAYQPKADAKISLDDTLRVNVQTSRRVFDAERLAQQPAGYYSYNIGYPADGEEVQGTLLRELRNSTLAEAPAPARFCLKRPTPLERSADLYVHLDCSESASCALHFPSPKWLEACPLPSTKTSRGFSLISQAVAAETGRQWSVPSAQTLAAHEGQFVGVGYTIFDIETDAFRDPAIIGVEVDIRVNGVPVREDGLAPALRPVPNHADRSFTHQFALESLDFEGAQGGCEAVVLTLTPRLAGGAGRGEAKTAKLAYVALRDKQRSTVPLGAGTLTWQARYVIPPGEWSHEAFITSIIYKASAGEAAAAAARERAGALKRAFDRLGLKFEGRTLVGVIRPPLTLTGQQLSYGLAAGVVQASGQVRFTFSEAEARRIGLAMLDARRNDAAARRVIDRETYIYRAAGNEKRKSTPTPPGVCSHVNA